MPRSTVPVSTRTTNGTVTPAVVVVIATSDGSVVVDGIGLSAPPLVARYTYVTCVATVQSPSSAAPSELPSGRRNCCVWQKNGVWCGPETIGPWIGQLRTATVAIVAPPAAGTTSIELGPTGKPLTTPSRSPGLVSWKCDVWSLPAASTRTALAAVPAGSATETSASPLLIRFGSVERIWIGLAGSLPARIV